MKGDLAPILAWDTRGTTLSFVILGLDPRIHDTGGVPTTLV
jgi:hypothetical protein